MLFDDFVAMPDEVTKTTQLMRIERDDVALLLTPAGVEVMRNGVSCVVPIGMVRQYWRAE